MIGRLRKPFGGEVEIARVVHVPVEFNIAVRYDKRADFHTACIFGAGGSWDILSGVYAADLDAVKLRKPMRRVFSSISAYSSLASTRTLTFFVLKAVILQKSFIDRIKKKNV